MRATVLGVAVASLVVVNRLSSQESAPRATSGGSEQVRGLAPDTGRLRSVADTIRFGDRVIAAGDSVRGPVVVAAGDLRVRGTIVGNAVAVAGDIIVEAGGHITGDAIAILGGVRTVGGTIAGAERSFSKTFGSFWGSAGEPTELRRSTGGALYLSLGWLVIGLLIGIGVFVFAHNYLEGATDVLEQSFWRSFLIGVVGEIAVIPGLVAILVALAITVVGILLIPFAIVAYVLATAGLLTLGFLAMARLTGGGVGAKRADRLSTRGSALRGLVLGIVIYLGMWVVAAIFQWSPMVSGALRGIALAITYVAITAGFGAAILSHGGTRRDVATLAPAPDDAAVWQTPTPVTGVVAARRPTPAGVPKQRA
jgi:hypothetical protein